ncbi:hypothetical protein HD806DRAFT_531704 [Xylariaceae sp. AK1471]|nr:hypothetical protein HD806DRAFT_531704 [Xylariaceae sp. AK1471]
MYGLFPRLAFLLSFAATVPAAPTSSTPDITVARSPISPLNSVDSDIDTSNGTHFLAARGQYGISCQPLSIYPYDGGSWELRGDCRKKSHKPRCSILPLDNCIGPDDNNNLIGIPGSGHIKDCTSCTLDGSRNNQWMQCNCNGHVTDWLDLNTIVGNNDGWLQCFDYKQKMECY